MSQDKPADASKVNSILSSAIGMTDLEEALFRPGGAEKAKELLARTEQLQARVQGEISAGLPPDQFERAQILASALAAVRDLLLRFSRLPARG
jgi:hypothetical protein